MERVTVVGGGIAGLTAAYRLRNAGFEVRVLEKNDYPGGRMSTETRRTPYGIFRLDRGAQFIASGYKRLHALCDELGVADQIRNVRQTSNAVLKDGKFHSGDYDRPMVFLRSKLIPWSSKRRLVRLLWDVWRTGVSPLEITRSAEFDRESMPEYVVRRLGKPALDYLFGPALSATFDADPEHFSALFLLSVVRFVLGGFRLRGFTNGTGALTEALAERLNVEYGVCVSKVERTAGGFRVHTSGGVFESERVVIAVPGTQVLDMVQELITSEEKRFFESVAYCEG
ncbi:MAG: FAD-dependent oxidoreductase, partial [Bacteroidia bacterium]|nr:FAD-dependent oxidoreductase [Bacteroidia bacterium]